jgi:hypothetical protein
MATASHSLATALWRARFASGLLRPSYTTSLDTTLLSPVETLPSKGFRQVSEGYRLSIGVEL